MCRKNSFSEVKCMAGPILETGISDHLQMSIVSSVRSSSINELLEKGYEIIQIVSHCSQKNDMTGTMFIMGKPAPTK